MKENRKQRLGSGAAVKKTTEEKVKKATVRPKVTPHKIFCWLPTVERL